MTLISKGMGIIMIGARKKLSVSPKASLSAWKDKAISTIESPRRKSYKKKFGKEPTVTIKHIDGKKETIIDKMILCLIFHNPKIFFVVQLKQIKL